MPQWDAIPAGVVESLCQRLQMDAIATGHLTIVKVTQPLATPQAVAAIASATPGRPEKPRPAAIVHRALPILFADATCDWRPVDVRQQVGKDDMVVELSAPLTNPYRPSEAGLFVRVTLGGEHESWYWLSLIPRAEQWSVGFVYVLAK